MKDMEGKYTLRVETEGMEEAQEQFMTLLQSSESTTLRSCSQAHLRKELSSSKHIQSQCLEMQRWKASWEDRWFRCSAEPVSASWSRSSAEIFEMGTEWQNQNIKMAN